MELHFTSTSWRSGLVVAGAERSWSLRTSYSLEWKERGAEYAKYGAEEAAAGAPEGLVHISSLQNHHSRKSPPNEMSGKSSGKRPQGLCGWLQLKASSDSAGHQKTESTQMPRKKRARRDNDNRKWEKSFGPMLIRRGCIAASERRTLKERLAALDDWDDNVTFMLYGKRCTMRRRICQYSKGGNLRYSYSGLVSQDFNSCPSNAKQETL